MNTTDPKLAAKMVAADQIAQIVGDFLDHLQAESGYPRDVILSGAHGQIVALIVAQVGPEVAASRFRSAADRALQVGAMIADPLMAMPVEGRA